MNEVQYDPELAHEFCRKNYASVKASRRAGCFYCCVVFDASTVTLFKSSSNAICPRCNHDTVICDLDVPIDSPEGLKLINDMCGYWFNGNKVKRPV